MNSDGQPNATIQKMPVLKKRPYTAPAFRFERVFEVAALSCGKIGPTQASCRFVSKTS